MKIIGGRILAQDVVDKNGKIIMPKKQLLTRNEVKKILEANVSDIYIRSPLSCKIVLPVILTFIENKKTTKLIIKREITTA